MAFNRRGVEDKHSNISSGTGDTSVQGGTLGKIECIDVIAGTVQTVTSHTVVDLVNPEVFDRLSCDSTLMFNSYICSSTFEMEHFVCLTAYVSSVSYA